VFSLVESIPKGAVEIGIVMATPSKLCTVTKEFQTRLKKREFFAIFLAS